MANLPITRYIDIQSGVVATSAFPERDNILRLFTQNPLLPTNGIIEFTSARSVGAYFGTASDEYTRSANYFSFGQVGKRQRKPPKISFARWNEEDVAARIYGAKGQYQVSDFSSIANGTFALTIGGVTNLIDGLDFTASVSLASVATAIQTEIRTKTGSQWTNATVTYNTTRGSFDFVSGAVGAATISVAEGGTGTAIAGLLGWMAGATLSNGKAAQSLTGVLDFNDQENDNWFIGIFMDDLTLDQADEIGQWNAAVQPNVKYQFSFKVSTLNYEDWSEALINYPGIGLTHVVDVGTFSEQFPANILAATDYDQTDATQNYMFQQDAAFPPTVFTSDVADAFDAARVNYVGRTQSAGETRSFYQRGYLCGPDGSPNLFNLYANEQWFKSVCENTLINLLLSVNRIPANQGGVAKVLAILQSPINRALDNGVISVGRLFNEEQKSAITQITQDPIAWQLVQTSGYWINAVVSEEVLPGGTEYKIIYTIVYAKDDVISKIEGKHNLV